MCGGTGKSGCEAVDESSYSSLLGIPLAAYGIFFYGAIAVIADGANILSGFPAACKASVRRIDVPTAPGMGKVLFPLDLVYIPPEQDPRCPMTSAR